MTILGISVIDFLIWIGLTLFIVLGMLVFLSNLGFKESKSKVSDVNHINDYIYKDYEKNYENNLSFRTKADNIKKMVVNDKIYDIEELAKKSNSSIEECIMIIKFLEKKKIMPNLYINTRIYKLVECSIEDEHLLMKYSSFLSRKINDYRTGSGFNFSFDELLHLYKAGLVPEIEVDEENRQIIFLDLSIRHNKDLISIACSNCGALNDVNRGQEIKCKYCGSKIIGPKK